MSTASETSTRERGSSPRARSNGAKNRLDVEDHPVHDWYRFVLSFPPHLVRDYLDRFGLQPGDRVLDPFCGTGTTVVEAKKHGISGVGIEANPLAHFVSATKVNWTVDPEGLIEHARLVAQTAHERLSDQGIRDDPLPLLQHGQHRTEPLRELPEEARKLLLRDSIGPLPLHKALVLLDTLQLLHDPRFWDHERLAFAKAAVFAFSNLHFGPEVGVGKPKPDAPVIAPWLAAVETMAHDLTELDQSRHIPTTIHHADARGLLDVLEPASIDAVITSPPYPSEKDYTRTTRLESVLLGFLQTKADLRAVKAGLVRSNTRNVYKLDADDAWVADHPEIQRLAHEIETRRIELGKTSGFERLYHRVTRLYFGGMARHLADLRIALKPGAHLAYVVGDQASYLRVMIRTGTLLADIAERLGYEVVGIDLFRTRLATATKEQLREETVVLRWPGAGTRLRSEQSWQILNPN